MGGQFGRHHLVGTLQEIRQIVKDLRVLAGKDEEVWVKRMMKTPVPFLIPNSSFVDVDQRPNENFAGVLRSHKGNGQAL